MTELETERLVLRLWKDSDQEPFAIMSADPKDMKMMGGPWPLGASENFINRVNQHFAKHDFGMYAVELKETGKFIGFVGLQHVAFEAHFTPAVEIGWRLGNAYWNNGYATEAARKVLSHGFNVLQMKEIVSFTSPLNVQSVNVMQKLGMKSDPQDNFRNPKVPADDVLSEHVLYRLRKSNP